MHKLLYFATIGLLAFSIGGCGGEGSDTASPSPSPSTPSPSPAASASPTPAAQTFQSPIVAAQPPGLIRSTNPDERARQASNRHRRQQEQESNAESSAVPIGPLTANPSQADPFGPLPPIALQIPSGANAGAGMTSALPKLPQRVVAGIPTLPEVAPPQIGAPIPGSDITFFPGGTGALGSSPRVPRLNTPQVSSRRHRGATWLAAPDSGAKCSSVRPSSYLPAWTRTPCSSTHRSAGSAGTASRQPPPQWRDPNARVRRGTATRPPGTTPIAARPQAAPNPQTGRPAPPNPQTRRPAPPRPPQPIAARPIGVPDLPELPVDNRPPQWRDPNPPPPPRSQ
jgi:hypothetical protein